MERVEDPEKFDREVFAPIPGRVSDTDVAREMDDFAAFAGSMGG